MNDHIGIIGAGKMGTAFYKGLSKEFANDDLHICDLNEEKIDALHEANTYTDTTEMVSKVGTVLFAVKPQAFEKCIESIHKPLEGKLIISIMAGISLDTLREKTGSSKIVRSMPNLPVQVGHGITGWIATDSVTDEEKEFVKKIFDSLGEEIEVKEEGMLDAITALSGSGPAYFFYLAELLEKKAIEMGLSEEDANKLAETTMVGSSFLLDANTLSPEELRKAVTSEGGTTEAALKSLGENKFDEIFKEGIQKANDRSKELNQ